MEEDRMRRKIAFILAAVVLNYNINVLADTSLEDMAVKDNHIFEGFTATSSEAEKAEETENPTESKDKEEIKQPEIGPNSQWAEKPAISPEESNEIEQGPGNPTEEDAGEPEIQPTEGTIIPSEEQSKIPEEPENFPTEENSEMQSTEEQMGELPEESAEITLEESDELIPEENIENSEEIVYSVLFPASIHAYLDPGNLSSRGQIFSEHYTVENYGNTDIAIKIKNIDIHCWSTEDIYEFSEEEVTDNHSRTKKLNVNMVWKNETENTKKILNVSSNTSEEYVIYLKAAEYDENGEYVSLNKGGIGEFYFTGTLNSNPNLEWEDGEITVNFDYEIINIKDLNKQEENSESVEGSEDNSEETVLEESSETVELEGAIFKDMNSEEIYSEIGIEG